MYDIEPKHFNETDDYWEHHLYKTKNSENQIIEFKVNNVGGYYYTVEFFITTKRKLGYQYKKQTGRDGLKSLIWAKQCLIHFIENIAEDDMLIIVYFDDKKRKNVYHYGLRSLGFRLDKYDRRDCLMLRIKK